MPLLLNCDLGESFGAWTMGHDKEVMPYIDQANIACGFHAGEPVVMKKTLLLAKQHGVAIGAHPSYPDLAGFGRRSIHMHPAEIIPLLQYQIAALDGMAQSCGLQLEYVKPHGALYNDMMLNGHIRSAVMEAIAEYHLPLKFMLQATTDAETHKAEAAAFDIELLFEAFADRRYENDGTLVSRTKPGAVLTQDEILGQVKQIKENNHVTTADGQSLLLEADSLCVHGDNPDAIKTVSHIREFLSQ